MNVLTEEVIASFNEKLWSEKLWLGTFA